MKYLITLTIFYAVVSAAPAGPPKNTQKDSYDYRVSDLLAADTVNTGYTNVFNNAGNGDALSGLGAANPYALNSYNQYQNYYPGSQPTNPTQYPYNWQYNRPPYNPPSFQNFPKYPPYRPIPPYHQLPYPPTSQQPFGIGSLFSASTGFGETNLGPGESSVFGIGDGVFGSGLIYPGAYGTPQPFGSFNYPTGTLLPNGRPIVSGQPISGVSPSTNTGFFNRFGLGNGFGLGSLGSGLQNGLAGLGRSIGRSLLRRTFGEHSTTTQSTNSVNL